MPHVNIIKRVNRSENILTALQGSDLLCVLGSAKVRATGKM